MIIAIDGTSGSGKSTIAKKLAKVLNFGFFSAGVLYRAITFKALKLKLDDSDDEKLQEMINSTIILYTYMDGSNNLKLDGIDITSHLHDEIISQNVAKYACKPYIREFVRKLQQEMPLHNKNIIMEGRDIGSVIFPNADFKIFVDCKVETRARRRFNDLKENGENVNFEDILQEIKDRDYKDTHRTISPLVMSKDAFLLDTSSTPVDDCLKILLNEIEHRNLK